MQNRLNVAQCQRINIASTCRQIACHVRKQQCAHKPVVYLLQELWLQHNQIASHSQLLALSTLPSLAVLFLIPNPLCESMKAPSQLDARLSAPSLTVLFLSLSPLCDSLKAEHTATTLHA